MNEDEVYGEVKQRWSELIAKSIDREWVKFGGTFVDLYSDEFGYVRIDVEISIVENRNYFDVTYADKKIGIKLKERIYFEDDEEDDVLRDISRFLYRVNKHYGDTSEWDWIELNKVKENI